MKDALTENNARVNAGPNAPEVATCLGMPFIPACGGVVLRSLRRQGGEEDLVLPPPARREAAVFASVGAGALVMVL